MALNAIWKQTLWGRFVPYEHLKNYLKYSSKILNFFVESNLVQAFASKLALPSIYSPKFRNNEKYWEK